MLEALATRRLASGASDGGADGGGGDAAADGEGGGDDEGAAEMEAMIKEIFQGQEYDLVFVVNAPSRIKKHK